MFQTVPPSSSGAFHCTHSNGTCHTGLLTACEQDQDGIQFRPDPETQEHSEKQDQDRTEFHPNPARKLSANLYDIHHCCVYSEKLLMMGRGTV